MEQPRNREDNLARLAGMRTILVPALAALLVVSACAAAAGPSAPAPSDPPAAFDPNGAWELVEGSADGQPLPLVEDARVTLIVEGSSVGGQSACNQYFGAFTVVDGRVTLGGLGGTEMACAEPVMALEAAYHAALVKVQAASMDGDALVLSGPDVELRFERLEPPPMAELVGTTWILDAVVTGDAVSSTLGEPATLVLNADGTLEGSTGCRTLTGRYLIRGDEVLFNEFGADGECPADVAGQDSHVVSVLGDGFRAAVDGQQLTLSDAGGAGLIYRVAAE